MKNNKIFMTFKQTFFLNRAHVRSNIIKIETHVANKCYSLKVKYKIKISHAFNITK